MEYPKASMRTPAGRLKTSPYIAKKEKKAFKLPEPSFANILPLNFTPSLFRQDEQGPKALCDYKLQNRLSSQLKLSAKMKQEAEAVQECGESTFKHVFRINREFFFNNILLNLLIIWNELIENMIEVFFEIDC